MSEPIKTVVIDGVEYVPKDTVFPTVLFDNLRKAYSDAFCYGVYDHTCESELCHREWRRFYDALAEINKVIEFKK